jgi:hypothetical protein
MLTSDELQKLNAEVLRQGLPVAFKGGPYEAFCLGAGVVMRVVQEKFAVPPDAPKKARRKK